MTAAGAPASIPGDPLAALGDLRVVPVVVIDDAADAEPLAHALVAGGLPVAEVTFRTRAAAAAIRAMATSGGIVVGAGTVVLPDQVDVAVEAGAQFVVSPGLSPTVVARCRELGVAVLPGAVTATEVQAALDLGIDTVKFFPAGTSGGPAAIAALAAPFAQVRFVPTGGVSPQNLAAYLAVPAVVAVGGSWMVSRELLRERRFATVTELSAQAFAAARSAVVPRGAHT